MLSLLGFLVYKLFKHLELLLIEYVLLFALMAVLLNVHPVDVHEEEEGINKLAEQKYTDSEEQKQD